MDPKDKKINIFLAILAPFSLAALAWALMGIPAGRIDTGVITLTVLTVFCSCYLRIQLPRVNTHLTISDALIMLAMLIYGGEVAVLLAIVETTAASLNLMRQGVPIKVKTIFFNVMTNAIAVFAAAKMVLFIFGSTDLVLQRGDFTSFVWLLSVMAAVLFAVNSGLVAVFSAIKQNKKTLWTVWTDNCFDAVLMYVVGAVMAGIIVKALEQINLYLFAAVVLFFGVIYLTFRRFVEDLKKTVEKAKQAERERAEQAEEHVNELEHYVAELERSGSALQESHENFRHAAYHDALTGLPNRNFFIDTLKGLLQQSRENSESNFAVLFLDLNRFKTINDSLGHSMGDRLIKNVAKRLSGMVREEDMVARFSGDKFGIVLSDLLSKEEATSFADRLAKRLAEPYTLDGRQVFTSAKIGIAYGNSKYPEAEDILRDADIAMYYSKDNEENYVIFDQKMHIRAVTRLQLETDLRFAIERNEFELYYQPIVGLENSSLVGFEALVRWNHPQRGLVPPNEFIPISESTGLIIPMTIQILHSACSQLVKWQERSGNATPLSVAVNLSGKHFGHPNLVEQINTIIAETGIAPASLKLELTEGAVMENAETAILMLRQIKETGVQISIDDFGTGYSSLSYLHRFPIDLLKVDRSFVSAMEENTENGEIVRTVIALAKALNLKVVAEGIESVHQFHQLRILGCEYGQGYLFSKPLPVADIERLLEDKTRWQNILPAAPIAQPQGRDMLTPLRLAQ
ncbi:MAG: bifunctional diguanylate cyclase/phosphodiesterase [Pyrinomonadaceae bacterium]|nr:bifunctional diguanylate cyclase/phosphodiesterase [Chloracidobacterium sp.]MBP7415868.1 bifunctional diguanylate cyclase/phosphodiesterase [Pyrinomonadaceae bacterium]